MRSNLVILFLALALATLVGYIIFEKTSLIQTPYQLVATANDQEISLQIDRIPKNKKGKMCSLYRYIEIQITGDLGEKLRVVSLCKMQNVPRETELSGELAGELEKIKIPFAHIFGFSPQSGEFSTVLDTKIYISNHQKQWSKKWKLEKFYFFNNEKDRIEISQPQLEIDVESLKPASAKDQRPSPSK